MSSTENLNGEPQTVKAQLNLVVNEPPLKRLKNHWAAAIESRPIEVAELSPGSLKKQLIDEETRLTGSSNILEPSIQIAAEETVLDKWRRSLLNSSEPASQQQIQEHNDIGYISDGFFSESEFTGKFVAGEEENEKNSDEKLSSFDFILSESDLLDMSSKYSSSAPFHRVKIVKIQESFYSKEGRKFPFPEKLVECLPIQNGLSVIEFLPIKLTIRDDWLHCRIELDSVINIIGPIGNGEITVDSDLNFLVTEPDSLVSTTVLADSFVCLRRAVLSHRTQPSVEDNRPSPSLICGSIVHELVEEAFRSNQYSDVPTVTKALDGLISDNIEAIFCAESDEKFVREKVMEMMQNFPKWCSLYLRKTPAIHAHVQDQIKTSASAASGKTLSEKPSICIPRILDLEENIWSPMFGLKGKIDATVILKVKDGKSDCGPVIAPLELKTGSSTTSVAHRAQTLLYTLLLQDRYGRSVDYGLLFYISTGDLIRIPGWRDEIRSILIARNRLAEEISVKDRLPAQITSEHLCKRCFQVDSCVIFHRLMENGQPETSSAPKLFQTKTEHLPENPKLSAFFQKWQNLINLEETETIMTRSELWRFDAERRARNGRCFNRMLLISCELIPGASGMRRHRCRFRRDKQSVAGEDGLETSLLSVQMNEGDPVVVSMEDPQQYAIAIGFISTITAHVLELTSDRPIKYVFAADEPLSYDEVEIHTSRLNQTHFRIDKDELTSSFGLLRANLYKLFSSESSKLLDLVVNLREPKFLLNQMGCLNESVLREHGMLEDFLAMDNFQREAFVKATQTLDYLLILGMPGSGKTTTLSFIIRYLVQVLNKSVLISSHTHSAIDHIALKLQEKGLPLLRIGNSDKIDHSINEDYLMSNRRFKTVAEVEHCYSTARIVVCTSLGINHPLFMRKRFDFCIIDEASQLTLPSCIGPLRLAQSFVLVGDHFQLPPLVRNKEALQKGFGLSLFKQLADAHPNSLVKLCQQYRMNEDIMQVANELVYNNLLQCGSESVRTQRLNCLLGTFCEVCSAQSESCWIARALNPEVSVLFLNTDECCAYEASSGHSFHNQGEAGIILQMLKSAVRLGISEEQITLISPYRPQLKHLAFSAFPKVEVSTIDKYQGRDRDCIIISFVRSNPSGSVGELLNDWQRLNVAFTRAKKKLILIGSRRTILGNSAFYRLNELLIGKDWILDLPADAQKHSILK